MKYNKEYPFFDQGSIFVNAPNSKIKAIDLFCGAGGLTYGLMKSGIEVTLGIDVDPACEYPYTQNNDAQFLLKDIKEVNKDDLQDSYKDADFKILAGCAPCQTFSTYNQKADSSDKRWWLLQEFSRLIMELNPDIVTMENVPGLETQDVFEEFTASLSRNKYFVDSKVVNCADYGMPQYRSRLVLLASKFGEIKILDPEASKFNQKTVKTTIGSLPPIKAGEIHHKDPLHQSAALSELNIKRIIASKQGGTWRDWPLELVADCHIKESGSTFPSVYGRMNWNKPSPTITTQFFGFGNGRFGHPEQNRAISLREGALLQTFPPDYIFSDPEKPIIRKIIGRLIGNAVPVELGEIIGKSIKKHIEQI